MLVPFRNIAIGVKKNLSNQGQRVQVQRYIACPSEDPESNSSKKRRLYLAMAKTRAKAKGQGKANAKAKGRGIGKGDLPSERTE